MFIQIFLGGLQFITHLKDYTVILVCTFRYKNRKKNLVESMPSPTEGKPALHLLEIWAFFKVVLNASYFLNGRFLFLRHTWPIFIVKKCPARFELTNSPLRVSCLNHQTSYQYYKTFLEEIYVKKLNESFLLMAEPAQKAWTMLILNKRQ